MHILPPRDRLFYCLFFKCLYQHIASMYLCINDYFLFFVCYVTKEAVWREMAPAAAAGNWRGCHSLCWWPGNRNPILRAPCRHFHQWKNPSWKICQKRNNSASKFININNSIFMKDMLFGSQRGSLAVRQLNYRKSSLFNV